MSNNNQPLKENNNKKEEKINEKELNKSLKDLSIIQIYKN